MRLKIIKCLNKMMEFHEEEDVYLENINHIKEKQKHTSDESESFISVEVSSESNNDVSRVNEESIQYQEEEEESIEELFDNINLKISINDKRINLLPSRLRDSIRSIIKKINMWTMRRMNRSAVSALQILHEKVDAFLHLQKCRDNKYESKCRELLTEIYKNIIDLQRIISNFKDKALPRSVDEYQVSNLNI